MRIVLAVVGLALLLGGVMLGLFPAGAPGATADQPMSCGSPWFRSHEDEQRAARIDGLANALHGSTVWRTDYRAACDDAVGGRGVLGGVAAGLGVVVLVGFAVVTAVVRTPRPSGA